MRWCWAGCDAARCSACGSRTSTPGSGACSSPRARAGGSGSCRCRRRFFASLGSYLEQERPATAGTDRVFVVLKGPAARRAAVGGGRGRDPRRCPGAGRAAAGDVSSTAPHLFHPAAGGGHGPGGHPGPGRSRLDRLDSHLPAPGQRLAGRGVPAGGGGDRSAGRSIRRGNTR